jgi:lipopolysaccharide/colanic/teichoic acid biosynthesis glycosyltransferase
VTVCNSQSHLDCTTLVVSTGPLRLRSRIIKRTFDTAVAAAALLGLSPLLIAVAVAIKLEDGGPVLFIQRRLGRGKEFSSTCSSSARCARKSSITTAAARPRDDDRIARIGAFIRRTSIDELP